MLRLRTLARFACQLCPQLWQFCLQFRVGCRRSGQGMCGDVQRIGRFPGHILKQQCTTAQHRGAAVPIDVRLVDPGKQCVDAVN